MLNRAAYRTEGATLVDLDGESLLYLEGDSQVHLLDPIAAALYRRCESASPSQLAVELFPSVPSAQAQQRVWQGLDDLRRIGALAISAAYLPHRRDFLAGASSLLVPAILSTALPSPANASSCGVCTPQPLYPVPVQTAGPAGTTSNPGLNSNLNADLQSGVERVSFSQTLCVPSSSSQILLDIKGSQRIDDAFSVRVNNDWARSRCFTSYAEWNDSDTCGIPAGSGATCVNLGIPPFTQNISALFSGLLSSSQCTQVTVDFVHCNFQGNSGPPSGYTFMPPLDIRIL